eukprot:2374-Rhodomonas_salina.1
MHTEAESKASSYWFPGYRDRVSGAESSRVCQYRQWYAHEEPGCYTKPLPSRNRREHFWTASGLMLPILEGLKEKGRNRSRRRRSSVVSSQGSGPMIRDVVGNGRSRRRMSMEHARRVSLDMTTLLVDRLPPPHCRLLDL